MLCRKDLPFDKLIEIAKTRARAAKKLAALKNDIPDSENLWKFCNIYSKAAVDEDKVNNMTIINQIYRHLLYSLLTLERRNSHKIWRPLRKGDDN